MVKWMVPIYPLQLDIHFLDCIWGCLCLLFQWCFTRTSLEKGAVEAFGLKQEQAHPMLSVRSILDAYLSLRKFPPGTRVLISGINIPTMVKLIQYHKLLLHPIPISKDRVCMTAHDLEAAINASDRPVAFILTAHLWGRLADLDPVFEIAKKYDLEVFEDCAESFDGSYKGDPRATLSAFSFGTIKHLTAFGGAILRSENHELLQAMRFHNDSLPTLSTLQSLKKILIPTLVYPFINLRFWFHPLYLTLQFFGIEPVAVAKKSFRNFGNSTDPELLVRKIRAQTSKTNLMILAYRLRNFNDQEFMWIQARRLALAHKIEKLPGIEVVGLKAPRINFWLFPLLIKNRDEVVKKLEGFGFTAYSSNSQLDVVPVSKELSECCQIHPEVNHIANDTLYLPVFSSLCKDEEDALVGALTHISLQISKEGFKTL